MAHNIFERDFSPRFGLKFPEDFELEPSSIEHLGKSGGALYEFADRNSDGAARYGQRDLLLDHALMLFLKLSDDPAFDGLGPSDIFTACLDTVMVWADG